MEKTARILLLFACLFIMGMGTAGETDVVRDIPEPDRKFKVEVVDASDMSFTVERFSVDGLTYVPVEMGRADIALDFAEIEKARFYLEGDKVRAVVEFAGGITKTVGLDPELKFYGRSEWGNLRLRAKDIKAIKFLRENI